MGALAGGAVEDAIEASVAARAEEVGEAGGERQGVWWQWFPLFGADFSGFGEDFCGFGEDAAGGPAFDGVAADGLPDEAGGCHGVLEVIALEESELFSGGGVGEFLGVESGIGVICVE